MRKNFKIEQSIYIRGEGFNYDLHNDYDFAGLQFSMRDGSYIKILFTRAHGDWVSTALPINIELSFSNLQYMFLSRDFFINRSVNIEELGYKEPNDEDLNWLVPEEKSEVNYHLIIKFDNEEYIRLCAENVEVI